jgi:hypothetical protein
MRILACLLAVTALHGEAVKNRAPLQPKAFELLPLGRVKPRGWLLRQLRIQAAGLSGSLDEFWPSVGPDSGWLGGTGESWERGPYYMDGLVPMAYLLDDAALIAKAKKWVGWTLANQRPDGAIGPAKNTDWWPNFVMLKVLTQYQEATGDERVIPLMERYVAYQLKHIDAKPLEKWAVYRWGDQVLSLVWLYNRTGNLAALELARKLAKQGYDWKAHFAAFKYTVKLRKDQTDLGTHVVNNAMAIKTSGVWWQVSGDKSDRDAVYQLLREMDRHHLLPNGVHGGDEHYAGRDPRRAPSCARWSRACSPSNTWLRSSVTPPSPTASRRWPTTLSPAPSTLKCGPISTTSSRTRCSAPGTPAPGPPTAPIPTSSASSPTSDAAPPTFTRAGPSWSRASGWRPPTAGSPPRPTARAR